MSKRIPITFMVNGKNYEIKRTRILECEYEKLTNESIFTEQEEQELAEYLKIQAEAEEFAEKLREAKKDFLKPENVRDKDKKELYLAYKELSDEKFNEMSRFLLEHKNFSTKKLQELSLENGIKIFKIALKNKPYELSDEEADKVWEDFRDKLSEQYGISAPREWILLMIQELFEGEDYEDEKDNSNSFFKLAKAKALQKVEQRKGLSKIKK